MSFDSILGKVFIDPSYPDYYEDRLFDLTNDTLNRDDTLVPFVTLRDELHSRGFQLRTADFLREAVNNGESCDYYSVGMLGYRKLRECSNVNLRAFVIVEPPVVAGHLYARLPELTSCFDVVYVHNVEGDGYSLDGVDRSKLRRFDWTLPHKNVLEPYWAEGKRQHKLVVINGHHMPGFRPGELYSERIRAVVALSQLGAVDLYGCGWGRLFSRQSLSWSYLQNRSTLLSVYRGSCRSKYDVLSRYKFCLCIENQAMNGYITEKLFDCMYAGTIPVYFGAKDVRKYVPEDVFVDARKFTSWADLWAHLRLLTREDCERIREAGRAFISGSASERFHSSLKRVFGVD